MKIDIHLSRESINDAIIKLDEIKENILYGLQQTVEILTYEGHMVASAETGSMADISSDMVDDTTGRISESGDAAVIAEFGAGDTVINPLAMFENSPLTEVYPGAYSLLEGTKEYATYGSWHFGGAKYTQVEPRMGLFKAKRRIVDNGTRIAQEVIKL